VSDALFCFVQVLGMSLLVAIGSHDGRHAGWGAYAFAAGFGGILMFRRRLPVPVLTVTVIGICAYYVLDYPPVGMALPAAAALYSAAERGYALVALGLGGLLLMVSVYFRSVDGESSVVLAYDLLTNAALVGCAIALALVVRSRRLIRVQSDRILALERLREREAVALRVQEERLRIARELHDSVGHALSVVSVQGNVAKESLGVDEAATSRSLQSILDAAARSLNDLRTILTMLRSPADEGTAERVPHTLGGVEQIVQVARDAGLHVDAVVSVGDDAIPPATATAAFRIAQEAVTNVLRHAQASRVRIHLEERGGSLHLRISDDGRSMGAVREGGGITGMRERAVLLGGELSAGHRREGFVVQASLPLRAR
jgi:signal transduction histidine kinase